MAGLIAEDDVWARLEVEKERRLGAGFHVLLPLQVGDSALFDVGIALVIGQGGERAAPGRDQRLVHQVLGGVRDVELHGAGGYARLVERDAHCPVVLVPQLYSDARRLRFRGERRNRRYGNGQCCDGCGRRREDTNSFHLYLRGGAHARRPSPHACGADYRFAPYRRLTAAVGVAPPPGRRDGGPVSAAHVGGIDAGDLDGLLHGIAAEGLTQFLVDHCLDQRGLAVLHLVLDRLVQRRRQCIGGEGLDALKSASLGDAGIGDLLVEFGADEVVVVPERRIALFRAPLVVPEDDHGDRRPFGPPDRGQFRAGDAEGAVAGKAHDRHVGAGDLGADDCRQPVAARPEKSRRQVFAPCLEARIGVAYGAIVADVGGNDGLAGKCRLDRAPGHARAHPVGLGLACAIVPRRAGIVLLVVHGGEFLRPGGFRLRDRRLALGASRVARLRAKAFEDAVCDLLRIADDADADRLGEADPVGIDVDLDDCGGLRPVVDAVAGQRRERVEPGAERKHHVGLSDQLHAGLGAVVAERAGEERMRAGEGVVVLVAAADRCVEALGKGYRGADRTGEHDTRAVENESEQLAQLGGRYNLALEVDMDKSHCPICNTKLVATPKEQLFSMIEKNTYTYYENFWRCSNCGQIYWQGAHWKQINNTLNQAQLKLEKQTYKNGV